MVSDLIESSLVGHKLEGLLFGGAPAPDSLVPRARAAFPGATMYVLPICQLFLSRSWFWAALDMKHACSQPFFLLLPCLRHSVWNYG